MKTTNLLKETAILLNYKGPSITELIFNETKMGGIVSINKTNDCTEIVIENKTAYNLKLVDKYIYNESEELIKQLLLLDDKPQIVFDKYAEATCLLEQYDKLSVLVS